MKKATSYKLGLFLLVSLYVFTALVVPETLPAVGPSIVLAIAFATVGFQGTSVADNWQRSKYYEPRLESGVKEQ